MVVENPSSLERLAMPTDKLLMDTINELYCWTDML
jgi:hypothetical protein